MAFRCTSCNGSMTFDIASGQMKCVHCGAMMKPEDFRVRDTSSGTQAAAVSGTCPHCLAPLSPSEQAEESCPYCGGALGTAGAPEDSGLARFSCQNCGAALTATDDSLIGLCPYCGGQSMLQVPEDPDRTVERLIPFRITREACTERYQDYVKKIRYLPRELRDPAYLQNFTGIYMPYYEYDAIFQRPVLQGTKTVEHNARYDVINTYAIPAHIRGKYAWGAPFDASRYLDDEISARVMPFDTSREMDFHPAYLSGFYADASTVPPELYHADAAAQAEKDLISQMGDQLNADTGIALSKASTAKAQVVGHHSVLFPLWFLTWRKNDRVAYAVINGESGKVVSDLPLDLRTFFLGCGLFALAIFLVLELLFQPTPQLTSTISLIGGILMDLGLLYSTKRVYEKQLHVKDKGYAVEAPVPTAPPEAPTEKPAAEKKKKGGCFRVSMTTGLALLVILISAASVMAGGGGSLFQLIVPLIALAVTVYAGKKVFSWQKDITEKDPVVAWIILLVTVVLNAVIVYISPVSDLWYYLGDAVCILGLLLAALGMLRIYNVSTTRPLPKLFGRKEVQA